MFHHFSHSSHVRLWFVEQKHHLALSEQQARRKPPSPFMVLQSLSSNTAFVRFLIIICYNTCTTLPAKMGLRPRITPTNSLSTRPAGSGGGGHQLPDAEGAGAGAGDGLGRGTLDFFELLGFRDSHRSPCCLGPLPLRCGLAAIFPWLEAPGHFRSSLWHRIVEHDAPGAVASPLQRCCRQLPVPWSVLLCGRSVHLADVLLLPLRRIVALLPLHTRHTLCSSAAAARRSDGR